MYYTLCLFKKTEQNTWGVLSSVPQNYTKMNKISEGQNVRQLLLPQNSQVRMFVNVGLQLTIDSTLILRISYNGL